MFLCRHSCGCPIDEAVWVSNRRSDAIYQIVIHCVCLVIARPVRAMWTTRTALGRPPRNLSGGIPSVDIAAERKLPCRVRAAAL